MVNCKANPKAISKFDFSALYTKLSHFDLISEFKNISEFIFKIDFELNLH